MSISKIIKLLEVAKCPNPDCSNGIITEVTPAHHPSCDGDCYYCPVPEFTQSPCQWCFERQELLNPSKIKKEPSKKQPYNVMADNDVVANVGCGFCNVGRGEKCVDTRTGAFTKRPHPSRIKDAMEYYIGDYDDWLLSGWGIFHD